MSDKIKQHKDIKQYLETGYTPTIGSDVGSRLLGDKGFYSKQLIPSYPVELPRNEDEKISKEIERLKNLNKKPKTKKPRKPRKNKLNKK